MPSRIYTLYKAFTATTDAAVNVIVIASARLVAVQWATIADLDADGEQYRLEVGWATTMQSGINDSQGAISCIAEALALTTSGIGVTRSNVVHPCDYPLKAGDKIYLHGLLTGVGLVNASVILHVR